MLWQSLYHNVKRHPGFEVLGRLLEVNGVGRGDDEDTLLLRLHHLRALRETGGELKQAALGLQPDPTQLICM